MFHPKYSSLLFDKQNNLHFDCRSLPQSTLAKAIVCETLPGQVLFVPSSWHHQVHNLDELVISINHNWSLPCIVEHMFDELIRSNDEIRIEIEDCRANNDELYFEWLCQRILKANDGFDLVCFILSQTFFTIYN